jgi:hypothetical protein
LQAILRLCGTSRTHRANAHTFEAMLSLILTIVGVVALLIARAPGRTDTITHRPYGKVYSGAPGANTESKPDDR